MTDRTLKNVAIIKSNTFNKVPKSNPKTVIY